MYLKILLTKTSLARSQEFTNIIIEEEQNPLQISSQVSQSHLHPEDEDSNEVLIIEDNAKEQREDSASHGSSSK